MTGHVQQFKNKISKHPKILHWIKLVSITAGSQVLIQVLGLVCGIFIIHLLPTKEYAFYTIANTMLGMMAVIADSGISSGLMAQGGKVWESKHNLGVVLATGLDLRKRFVALSLLITTPILIYLLVHHGASLLMTSLIVISLIPGIFSSLSDSLLEVIPKLHQDIKPLQKNQLLVGALRLALTFITIFVFPFTYIAILATGLPRTYGNYRLKKISYAFADKDAKPNIEVKQDILKIVKRILPGSIYYSFSGQITIWAISVFGHTKSVAQIGALGRLSMILTLVGAVFSTIIVPRFARLNENRKLLFKRVLHINALMFIICLIIILLFYCFSDLFLLILGKNYQGLNKELVLNIIGSCISLMAGLSFTLYTSRGWAIRPYVLIPIDFIAVIIGLFIFKVDTVTGVLYYNIFLSSVLMGINGVFIIYKVLQIDRVKNI